MKYKSLLFPVRAWHLRALLNLALSVAVASEVRAQFVINELMQSDIGSVVDDLNEFPDSWVELYNTSDRAAVFKDYSIGLSSDPSQAWPLPPRYVPAHGRFLIYCDKEATGWHTDFRLESTKKGTVYLFKAQELQDSWTDIPAQLRPGVSYGCATDGHRGERGFLVEPTPLRPNCGQTATSLLPTPIFSQRGCVVTNKQPIELSMQLPAEADGSTVFYTLDGSMPTPDATPYTRPLRFDTTTVVRAQRFKDGAIASECVTESFIFHPRELTMPVISLTIDPRFLYDEEIGINCDDMPNWTHNWRRPMNFEYYEGVGTEAFLNQLGEMRMAGSKGARYDTEFHPFVVYANKRFGHKYFKHEFFPDDKPGLTDFKSLFLRNSGNDCGLLHFRDAAMQRSVARHVDLDWQGNRPAIVYLNGQYYGLLNIRERSSSANIFANYDHLEDIDLICDWNEVDEGTIDEFNRFVAFYSQGNHTLEEWNKAMDVEEFMNLMIANMYYANIDFPLRNIRQWRERNKGNARWRWVCFDMDVGMGLFWNDQYFPAHDWMYNTQMYSVWPDQSVGTLLWRKLMENAEAREMWIDRFAVFMGDFLNLRSVEPLLDKLYDDIDVEFRTTAAKWGFNLDYHAEEMDNVKHWMAGRTGGVYLDMANHFGLGQPHNIYIYAREAPEGFSVQGIPVKSALIDGQWFEGRELRLTTDDAAFTFWQVTQTLADGTETTTHYPSAELTLTMPPCERLSIVAHTDDLSGINPVSTTPTTTATYDLAGRRIAPTARGIYIKDGKKVLRTR